MGSTFALPEATALTSSLRRGAGTVLNTALGSHRPLLTLARGRAEADERFADQDDGVVSDDERNGERNCGV